MQICHSGRTLVSGTDKATLHVSVNARAHLIRKLASVYKMKPGDEGKRLKRNLRGAPPPPDDQSAAPQQLILPAAVKLCTYRRTHHLCLHVLTTSRLCLLLDELLIPALISIIILHTELFFLTYLVSWSRLRVSICLCTYLVFVWKQLLLPVWSW